MPTMWRAAPDPHAASDCVAPLSMRGVCGQGQTTRAAYGGVVFGYNETVVRMWAPTVDSRDNPVKATTNGATVMIGNGWGNQINAQSASTGVVVKVQAWLSWNPAYNFADIRVTVKDVNEPPRGTSINLSIQTVVGLNAILAIIGGSVDEDVGSKLTYSIVAGDPDRIFALSPTGVLTVTKNAVRGLALRGVFLSAPPRTVRSSVVGGMMCMFLFVLRVCRYCPRCFVTRHRH
jgi:hypothetical protein